MIEYNQADFLLFQIFVTLILLPRSFATIGDVIDVKSPIVIRYDGKGNSNTYFGYSMAFMDSSSRQTSSSFDFGTLFIGAPQEIREAPNFGIVWRCTFQSFAGLSCAPLHRISEQPTIPPNPKCAVYSYRFNESVHEQWIGSSLTASHDALFACAPRWKINSYAGSRCREEAMTGSCYEAVSKTSVTQHVPFDEEKRYFYKITFTNGKREQDKYHNRFAQFGFSSHATNIGNLVVGAPGILDWTGNYVEYINGRPIVGPDIAGLEPLSYMGYAVTSGRTPDRDYYLAVGAPRANRLYGAVFIITSRVMQVSGKQFASYFGFSVATADLDGNGRDELLVGAPMHTTNFKNGESYNVGCMFVYSDNHLPKMEPLYTLCYPQQGNDQRIFRGARFGSAIVNLGDINFDRRDDFAVSAPYDDEGTGTVFIYSGGLPFSTVPSKIIRGENFKIPNLQSFGSSLLSDLDVDGNGTPDLAIGSFESGHIVILRTRPIARPLLNITFHNVDSKDSCTQRIQKFLPTHTKLCIRTCVTFEFSVLVPVDDDKFVIKAWLQFEVDPVLQRFRFKDGEPVMSANDLHVTKITCVNRLVEVQPNIIPENPQPVFFQTSLWYNETVQLSSSPSKHATIVLHPNPNGDISQDRNYKDAFDDFIPFRPAPIEKIERNNSLQIAVDDCGNLKCDPDLKLTLQLFYVDSNGKEEEIHGKKPTLRVGQVNHVRLSVTVSNMGQAAYSPVLSITSRFSKDFVVHPELERKWRDSPGKCNGQQQNFEEEESLAYQDTLVCSKPLLKTNPNKYTFSLRGLQDLKVLEKLTGRLHIAVEAYPEVDLNEKVSSDVEIQLEANVEVAVDVFDAMAKGSEVDPRTTVVELTQFYILRNTKYSSTAANTITAQILIPTHITTKNKKTEILGIANPNPEKVRCRAENFLFFNPSSDISKSSVALEHNGHDTGSRYSKSLEGNQTRIRRSASSEESASELKYVNTEYTSDKSPTLPASKMIELPICDVMSDSCKQITCTTDLETKGSREIRLKMYILPEVARGIDTESTYGIRITTSISVKYLRRAPLRKSKTTQRLFIREEKAPLYIYLLAAGGGLIVVVFIVLCLCRAGFFKRTKLEELKELKRKTQMIAEADLQRLHAALEGEIDGSEL